MIDSSKVEALVTDEMAVIEAMLDVTQQFLDLCDGQSSPELAKMRLAQVRTLDRVKACPAAVLRHGPFKDAAAVHAAVEREVRFVAAALDHGGH